jgi:hypothetical protein
MTPDEIEKKVAYREVECTNYTWEKVGESQKVEVVVTAKGMDEGKKEGVST